MQPRDIIIQLLGSLGSQKEVQQYLQRYAAGDEPTFGVVKVGGQTIREDMDRLADALAFLQELHLRPVVVHGAGPQLTSALRELGIEPVFKDGLRVTTPEVLEVARRVFHDVSEELVEALCARGVNARPISSRAVHAEVDESADLGLVGEVRGVNLGPVLSSVRAGALPVIPPLGETASGQILNVNADMVTRAMAKALSADKVVFLSSTGGLLDENGRVIAAVNLVEDYDRLMGEPWLSDGMRLKIQEIKALLDELPATSSVSITSPAHLARELFTHKGAGTLVRRGERVVRYRSFDQLDREQLKELIETVFGRPLTADYFEKKNPIAVYLADHYRAAAIVTEEEGVPYLDKFVVTREAQGAGVGASVWARMTADHPRLFWRARSGNPINPWYFSRASGTYRNERWVVFWIGEFTFDELEALTTRALSMPATLGDHAEGSG